MILVINTGSSSLKVALYSTQPHLELHVSAEIDRLDGRGGIWELDTVRNQFPALSHTHPIANHADALHTLWRWLREQGLSDRIAAVGHRIVHGGAVYSTPVVIDDAVIRNISRIMPMDPGHLPQAIACIQAIRGLASSVLQIACFDTAFHRTMPREARRLPLPRRFEDAGIARYGFHGLSYEYIQRELEALDPESREKATIIAHLGNGASMVAIRDGQSIDTTMGMTPTGGLMMGTRTGDLDPGILVFLMQKMGLDATAIGTLVNKESGLLGVSGTSGDMRDLEKAATTSKRAREAIALFCYQARKHLGALTAALEGLDRLVFTGGIGEHSAPVRDGICRGFGYLGMQLDPGRNAGQEPVISQEGARVEVRVMTTNEDRMIVQHTLNLLKRA